MIDGCLCSCADDCFGFSACAVGAGELAGAVVMSGLVSSGWLGGLACTRLTWSRGALVLRLARRGAGERGGTPSNALCLFGCLAAADMEMRGGGVDTEGEAAREAFVRLSGGDDAGWMTAASECCFPCLSASGLTTRGFGTILRFFCALALDGLNGAVSSSFEAAAAGGAPWSHSL